MSRDNYQFEKDQITEGKKKELENHRKIVRPINRKILEQIPVTDEEIEEYKESMWRVQQRSNYYDRARKELD